jgi:hypothetical protein
MPAVMERLFNYYAFENFDVEIGFNGEIIIKEKEYGKVTKVFTELEEGALFSNFDKGRDFYEETGKEGKYYIDEYGMDRSFTSCGNDPYMVSRTEDGFIVTQYGGIGCGEGKFKDDGDPILLGNTYGRTWGWEMNKLLVTSLYPMTQKWFDMREKNIGRDETEEKKVEETGQEQQEESIEIRSMKNRLDTLKKKYEEMENENDELKKEKKSLQSMLKTTLDVCEKIKRSPIGRIFFGGKLNQLPEASDSHEEER